MKDDGEIKSVADGNKSEWINGALFHLQYIIRRSERQRIRFDVEDQSSSFATE